MYFGDNIQHISIFDIKYLAIRQLNHTLVMGPFNIAQITGFGMSLANRLQRIDTSTCREVQHVCAFMKT